MNEPDPLKAGAAMIQAVKNQIAENNPPEVKVTLDRLIGLGIEKQEALKYIACAFSVEVFGAIKNSEEFDPERYDNNLSKLPELPWDNE